ncbi:hypothetical protein HAZT_HAZT000841, partial [Hyalella azteca]
MLGHGADVKCVAWHPSRSLLASGSKDNQQPIKLWDPRTGTPLAKLHAHKSTVMDLKWNANGNWLCSASRDHLLKLFDVRNLGTEMQVFRGHKREASAIAWHPQHEGLFASGGSDGSILFWHVGNDKEVGSIDSAHDGIIWDLAWHPLGHILSTGSNDHTTKFWTRNRPGDKMRDRYNLNTLPPGVLADDSMDIDDIPLSANYEHGNAVGGAAIPGMGPDDKIQEAQADGGAETIPGLDFDAAQFERFIKKTPYAKPIPKNFQAAWNAAGGLEDEIIEDPSSSWVVTDVEGLFSEPVKREGPPVITETGEELPPGSVPLDEITADAIAYYGFFIPLDKVPGNVIQDAFSFMHEDEAIAELTKDSDFARKLCREKRQLLNPNAKDDEGHHKGNQEDPFNYHNTQSGSSQNNRTGRSGNFNRRDHDRRDGGQYNRDRGGSGGGSEDGRSFRGARGGYRGGGDDDGFRNYRGRGRNWQNDRGGPPPKFRGRGGFNPENGGYRRDEGEREEWERDGRGGHEEWMGRNEGADRFRESGGDRGGFNRRPWDDGGERRNWHDEGAGRDAWGPPRREEFVDRGGFRERDGGFRNARDEGRGYPRDRAPFRRGVPGEDFYDRGFHGEDGGPVPPHPPVGEEQPDSFRFQSRGRFRGREGREEEVGFKRKADWDDREEEW